MSGESVIKLAEQLIEYLQGEQISPENIMRAIVRGMVIVEKITDLNGVQKKDLLISAIKHIINGQIQQEEIKNTMFLILESAGSRAIDMLVSAAKGDYNFGEASTMKKLCCC
jgi:hypothetical protein